MSIFPSVPSFSLPEGHLNQTVLLSDVVNLKNRHEPWLNAELAAYTM